MDTAYASSAKQGKRFNKNRNKKDQKDDSSKKGADQKKPKKKCDHCKKTGHAINVCLQLKKRRPEENATNKKEVRLAPTQESAFMPGPNTDDPQLSKFQRISNSGSTRHMTGIKDWIMDYKEFRTPVKVNLADGKRHVLALKVMFESATLLGANGETGPFITRSHELIQ